MADIYATFGAATRNGALSAQTDIVERLTGRAPGSVRELLAAAL
jgi:hypothetical protein